MDSANGSSYSRDDLRSALDFLGIYVPRGVNDSSNITTNRTSSMSDWLLYPFISSAFRLYGAPLIFTLGTIGNLISIVVLLQRNIRKASWAMYLVTLGFSDLLVLYTFSFKEWLVLYGIYLETLSDELCKTTKFLEMFSPQCTSWILVGVTVERCIYVCSPGHAKRLCTRRNAFFTIAAMCLFLFCVNIPVLLMYHLEDTSKYVYTKDPRCLFDYGIIKTLEFVELCLLSLIPFIIMLICDFLMIKRLYEVQNMRSGMLQMPAFCKARRTVFMLLTVNITFVILTLPYPAIFITYHYLSDARPFTTAGSAKMSLIISISKYLQQINSAINFLLYCVSSPQFRRELKALIVIVFCKRCGKSTDRPQRYQSEGESLNGETLRTGFTKVTALKYFAPESQNYNSWLMIYGF
ncbi:unnamed protein product [Owenia fusiformis]|uniref:G-protein coupled receptors family 1 profile domain-containing protein n=1 Tax=Owenia fusiformis TaxID=6347 RepID=A0A8S4NBF4_OWEFU|nr:unnamed protein product [Owenia fusiformis]